MPEEIQQIPNTRTSEHKKGVEDHLSDHKSTREYPPGHLTVRSELNLEQNSIFTVSTYRGKWREIALREKDGTGKITERKAIIGKTAGGVETGVLTTNHFKVYLALLDLWERAGRPVEETVSFTTLRVMKRIGMRDSGEEYRRLRRWLRDLRQIPVSFINAFYVPAIARHTDLADVTILNHIHIYERKNAGKGEMTRGYGEFQFDRHILASLMNNNSHPLRLDVIRSFRRRRDLAILLYTYLDRNLAFRNRYEIRLEKLFYHLDLSQEYVPYPAKRKHRIKPVLDEIQGRPLSTGILSRCHIDKTEDGMGYKLVCHKKPSSMKVETEEKASLASPPGHEESSPELLSALMDRGLTEKQAQNLVCEYDGELIEKQMEYLPFRIEEYKAQGQKVRDPAILYSSIKDNWQPPSGYFEAQKAREREAKRRFLAEEFAERAKKARIEAAEWASRSAEDRIKSSLDFWIKGEKLFRHRELTTEEIEIKKQGLIDGLPTMEEYEQRILCEIRRDINQKESQI
jgi:hypothetical protein